MAISDSQKVDYLFKKIGFGFTKTDTTAYKEAFNESIPSPMLLRGENVWQLSGSVPTSIPSSSSAIVTVYKDTPGSWTATVQCTEDITASDNRTWKTNLTDWIPPEFGATYQAKVYIDTTGSTTPQTTGTQIYAAGSGNSDEWFFDYQSGVLHFIGTNIPTAITTGVTGKSIFVSGARYVGAKGLTDFPNGANIANIVISTNTISSNNGNLTLGNLKIENTTLSSLTGNLYLSGSSSNSKVIVDGTGSLTLPSGTDSTRPENPTAGDIRFSTSVNVIEFFNGTDWIAVTNSITDQQIEPDGVSQSYELDKNATSAGVIVSINGTVQTPGLAYTCSGTTITFAEIPQASDYIDIRFIATAVTTNDEYETITTGAVTVGTSTAIVDSFPSATFRSAKYTISSTNSDAQFYEVMLTQYDGDVAIATTSNVRTGTEFITFSANVNGSTVNLLAQGSISSNSLRIKRVYFNV